MLLWPSGATTITPCRRTTSRFKYFLDVVCKSGSDSIGGGGWKCVAGAGERLMPKGICLCHPCSSCDFLRESQTLSVVCCPVEHVPVLLGCVYIRCLISADPREFEAPWKQKIQHGLLTVASPLCLPVLLTVAQHACNVEKAAFDFTCITQ